MPAVKYWDGAAWVTLQGGIPVYEQPSDPGAVQNGTIWIDTDEAPSLAGPPPRVSVLPTVGLVEGQEVLYEVGDGVLFPFWHLRYRANSGLTYKWECISGQPLFAEGGGGSTSSTSFVDLGGPSITLPLAGEYDIEIGCAPYAPTAGQCNMSYQIGATVAQAADSLQIVGNVSWRQDATRRRRKTIAAAGTVLTGKYSMGSGTGNFANCRIWAWPVRF
jgi:hypothetical protein